MLNAINRKINYSILLLCIMIISVTLTFCNSRPCSFQRDSEDLVVSMIVAGRYNFDIGNRYYGLGKMAVVGENVPGIGSARDVYDNHELYKLNNKSILEYKSQIGLQGWIFYFIAKLGVPYPLHAIKLGCCFLLASVISLICYELYKKYGLLFAIVFYIISTSSSWIRNFAPNLYWVEFTWFIPMLLGLYCLNNLNKRWWLYPLFFVAICVKSACGYEYITVIMLSSIMFLIVEWVDAIKKDKKYSKLLFRTIFMIGIMSLLGFATAIMVHSYMRGDGDILAGFNSIYQQDVLRRTFGNATDFPEVYAKSLNSPIIGVLFAYFTRNYAGILAFSLLIASIMIFVRKHKSEEHTYSRELLLFVISFLTCISWFVLAKSHSYIHTHMNFVMWYMGFMQVGFYIIIKFTLRYIFSDKNESLLKQWDQIICSEVNRDI